jgi:hypothetical protein
MKSKLLVLTTLVSTLSSASLLATTPSQTAPAQAPAASATPFERVDFSEAAKLHRAYHILATGDHDYHGHRAKAMEQVKKAAALLGVDLSGDDRDREKQALSDDLLREARGNLHDVLNAAEVKGQERISKHIQAAIDQIDTALKVH